MSIFGINFSRFKRLNQKRIAEECQVDLIDAVKQPDADLSSYDMIGIASGIYFSKCHQSILEFAEKNLPDDKKIPFNDYS